MLKFRKLCSLMLIITFFTMLFSTLTMPVVQADSLITLSVQKDENLQDKITDSSVTLEWNQVYGAKSYRISYQDYADDNIGVAKSVYTDAPETSYEITALETNIIYNFTVEAMTDYKAQGSVIASDDIKVLIAISFQSSNLTDTVIQNNFDRESGVRPALNMKWQIPLIWDGNQFNYVDSDLVNYKITVGVTKAATDAGIYNIKYNGADYEVYKENTPADIKLAYAPVTIESGQISYEWRYWDPVNDAVNDSTIKPGTIYYAKIIPQFSSSIGDIKYQISSLMNGYAYTPLHIKVGKDSNNNIICTIYRINYDNNNGENKINFKYEIYSSPDAGMASPSLEGYEYEQYGDPELPIEIFIPEKDATSTFYYLALAKSDGLNNVQSPIVDYNMAADAGRPSIPQELSVSQVARVTGVIGEETVKSADVTLRWQQPNDFADSKENLDFYILINSVQSDVTDSNGDYYKELIDDNEYDIKYRLVKVVNGASLNIDTSETGYIKYTLKGLELFTKDDDTPISNPDSYPEQLKLNKVYYLKIFAKKIDADTESDFSIPVSFTTPVETLKKPPIPEMFNTEQVESGQIRLIWQRDQINLEDYDAEGQDYSVYYEVYMNDSISKNSDGSYQKPFVFAGSSENPLHALFTGGTGNDYNIGYATLDEFTGDDEFTQRFGSKIKPNAVYYFVIRTKLVIEGQPDPMYSEFSQILPVTTPKEGIEEPGEDEKTPLAPVDFAVQLDATGNKNQDSYSAVFTWTKLQEGVTYRIARTLKSIQPYADISELEADQGYDLNQYVVPEDITPNSVNKYVYEVSELWPNTLYYFSMRAERSITQNGVSQDVYSSWITIPLTTSVLEAPDAFELVRDTTYNKYTQLKVAWRTKEYFDSEIWIRAVGENDYSKWTSVSIVSDKPTVLQGTDYKIFYATISGLKSSSKYYIKVRNRVSRTVNGSTVYDYSKFIGPLETRTEFSQSDYNEDENDKADEIVFTDRMKILNDSVYWILTNSESLTKLKIIGSKAINVTSHSSADRLVIDLTKLEKISTKSEIYIPFDLFDYINKNNKILSIRSSLGEILFRARTIDAVQKDICAIKNEISQGEDDIEDVFIKITVERIDSGSASIPTSMKNNLSSGVLRLNIDALGMSDVDQNIETKASTKLASLIQSKLKNFKSKSKSAKDTDEELEELFQEYIEDCSSELGEYIEDQTEDLIEETKVMSELSNSIKFKLIYNAASTQGQQTAYQYANSKWSKLITQVNIPDRTAIFESKKPGLFASFKNSSQTGSSTNSQLTKQFADLESKYSISEVIATNGSYDGQANVNFKEMLEVVGKILGEDIQDNDEETIAKMNKRLGLNSRASMLSKEHKLTREEAAYIAAKLYATKTGMNPDNYKPGKSVYLADAQQINPVYYKAVVMAVDLKLISPNSSNKILPVNSASKDDSLYMIKKVLLMTGDI